MANLKSSIKSIRKDKKRRARNTAVSSAVKSAIKKALAAIEAKTKEAEALVRQAVSVVDKAVENGIVHKNTAARKKSRLLKKFNASLKK